MPVLQTLEMLGGVHVRIKELLRTMYVIICLPVWASLSSALKELKVTQISTVSKWQNLNWSPGFFDLKAHILFLLYHVAY